ncbi:MAG TPA: isochorismate synthase [Firmicutes bacterium]|nr:isochorismate synthase [Bacillota bacterium]
MIEIQLKHTKQQIKSVIEAVKSTGCSRIVCLSCETNIKDLLMWSNFFHFAEGFFWTTPNRTLEMMGICPIVAVSSKERKNVFEDIQKKWKEMLHEAKNLVQDQLGLQYPISFGSFTFDAKQPHQEIWQGLEENLLFVPEFLCIKKGEQISVILQLFVTNQTTYAGILDKIRMYEQLFCKAQHQLKERNLVISKVDLPYDDWRVLIEKAKVEIAAETLQKIVLARASSLRFQNEICVSDILKRLYQEQLESYVFLLSRNGKSFIGATPERLLYAKNRKVFSACVAGTQKRGSTESEDHQLGRALLMDDKNACEHRFVVEKIKEVFATFCDTYDVPEMPVLLKNKFVQHLYTPIEGVLKTGTSLFSLMASMHPTPALGGIPKRAALQFLRDEEHFERGWYGAPIGWLDQSENGEFIVGIRSGLVAGKAITLFAGCGIVADSDAKLEYEETALKFKPMLESMGVTMRNDER